MAAKRSRKLDLESLAALGAERLAQLVLVQAEADPVFARAVRMALVASEDSGALAHGIDKRLKTIRRSRGFLEWDKATALARELDQLRGTIAGPLAAASPEQAAGLMLLLLGLANSVLGRSEQGGRLAGTFRDGVQDLGALWSRAGTDPERIAAEVIALVEADGYGVLDELPDAGSPALGSAGRAAMRRMLLDRRAALTGEALRGFDFRTGWLLPRLADLDGDVDAFIATVDPERRNAITNAKVATRLIAAGRAAEALEWIDAPTDRGFNQRELAGLRLQALEALGRKDDAQAQRREIFEQWLDADMLRAWLKHSQDFDEFGAEQKALDFVAAHPDAMAALAFLTGWPDFPRAGRLVRTRLDALDARSYDRLRPAAEMLGETDPGAAALLYRRLVDGVLGRAVSKYYPYAAKDFAAAAAAAARLADDGGVASHDDWIAELRRAHGRKEGFWSLVEGRR